MWGPEEYANHAIFECPPDYQAWALAATSTHKDSFPISSLYTNFNYLFWRKSDIEDPEMDRDPYPWVIWYPWKARNDKLFRGIDRDPHELIRYAEGEWQAWLTANVTAEGLTQVTTLPTLAIRYDNACYVDGSSTSTSIFSGYGWSFQYNNGGSQLMGTRNQRRRESTLHAELEALRWAMECMMLHVTCQHFGTECKDVIAMLDDHNKWPSFSTELEEIQAMKRRFHDFKIFHIPREDNRTGDCLARPLDPFIGITILLVVLFQSGYISPQT